MKNKHVFDVYEPLEGHVERFEKKLKQHRKKSVVKLWQYSAVAGVALVVGLFMMFKSTHSYELASVSPKLKTTQAFFEGMIANELHHIENADFSKHPHLKNETFDRLKQLENDYDHLKKQLKNVGYNSKIVHAMIINFQQRLEILENVNQYLQQQENLKPKNNEQTTI